MRNTSRALLIAALLGAGSAPLPAADPNDPMRPERPEPASQRGQALYHLSAVFASDERRSAVLNGRLVRVGHEVGRARVVAIEADRVILDVDGVERIARLNHPGTPP